MHAGASRSKRFFTAFMTFGVILQGKSCLATMLPLGDFVLSSQITVWRDTFLCCFAGGEDPLGGSCQQTRPSEARGSLNTPLFFVRVIQHPLHPASFSVVLPLCPPALGQVGPLKVHGANLAPTSRPAVSTVPTGLCGEMWGSGHFAAEITDCSLFVVY